MNANSKAATVLRPEDIGSMGQHFLALMAKSAGLVTNASGDDKAGWDYELETASPTTIDYRSHSKPIYRIQVKSTSSSHRSVALTYSSLLSLIRFPGPAFLFFVMFAKEGGTAPIEARLLHLDERLSRTILIKMRKREVEQKEKFKVNKATTSFNFESALPVELQSGSHLRTLLDRGVGGTYLDYVSGKSRWLQQLEQESNALRMKCLFEGEADIRAMADALLGYESRPMVDVVSYVAPLGIPDEEPMHSGKFSPAEFKPSLESIREVEVRLKARKYGATYTFPAKLYSNKGMVPDKFSGIRVHGSMFDIRINAFTFEIIVTLASLDDRNLVVSIRELRNFVAFMDEASNLEITQTHLEIDLLDGTRSLCLSPSTRIAIHEWHSDLRLVLDALYRRLDGIGLGDAQVRPARFLDMPGSLTLLTHVNTAYAPEFEFDFEAPDANKPDANLVIFRTVLELEAVRVCYFAAFFGSIELHGEGKASGKFFRSEYLDEVVVPVGADLKGPADTLAARLEKRLEAQGFRVL